MADDPFDYGKLDRIDFAAVENDGPVPTLSSESIRTEAKQAYELLRDFVTTDPFLRLLDEVYSVLPEDRDEIVRRVILVPEELAKRGIYPPEGVKLQRSQFGDNRPTVFCVTKVMTDGVRKVTYTFDSSMPLAHAG